MEKHSRLEAILEGLGGERRIDYTLDRFRNALTAVGNPEKNAQTLVIAGTNGKGSTALFVSAGLVEAGFSVGTFLSPHLQSPTERFLFGMRPEAEERLADLAVELEPVGRTFSLTYFEFTTLMLFVWAKRRALDFLVIEVGLGGRLDATNVSNPIACAITTIDWDHQDYLGDTLEKILDEKMGVLREEGLVFSGIENPGLKKRLEARCEALDTVYYYSDELRLNWEDVSLSGQTVTINGFRFRLTNPSAGTVNNAALAFLLLRIVFPKFDVSVFQRAFARVKTPGRMELVQREPNVVLSGDHNLEGIRNLHETLRRLKIGKINVLCAFSPDKPYREIIESLKSVAANLLLTELSRNRGKMPADYSGLAEFEPDAETALRRAMGQTKSDETLLVTGSLYLVGELRRTWHPAVDFLRSE